MEKVLDEVKKTTALKHTTTTDKSAPGVNPAVKVNKGSQQNVLSNAQSNSSLSHSETVDKSVPVIEPGVKVGKSTRGTLLDEIAKKKK